MLISTMEKHCGGKTQHHSKKCCYCGEKKSVVIWCIGKKGYIPLCAECTFDLAMGMLRDFEAFIVGEKEAQRKYVEVIGRLKPTILKRLKKRSRAISDNPSTTPTS